MSDLDRARQWRQRAEELRTTVKTEDARKPLQVLADNLDRMAERLERRERPKVSPG
jgi:hypothetical protein